METTGVWMDEAHGFSEEQWQILKEQTKKHYYPTGGAAVGFAGSNLMTMQSAQNANLVFNRPSPVSVVPPTFFSQPANRNQRRAAAKKAEKAKKAKRRSDVGRAVGYRS